MSLIAYFFFCLSTILIFLYLSDLIFYFQIFFKLENLVYAPINDKLLATSVIKQYGLFFDLDFYLLFFSFLCLILWNIMYSIGSFFWLKIGSKKSEIFKNLLTKIFQMNFFLGLYIFFNYYLFDFLSSIFIFFYLFVKYGFYYFTSFFGFLIKFGFMIFFYYLLKRHRMKYKELFSSYFKEFKNLIFNDFSEKKKFLEFYENEKKDYKNKEFHLTLNNFISEKEIIIKEILNYSNLDEIFLSFIKNYFLMQNQKLDEFLFLEKYLYFLKFENKNIQKFLKNSYFIIKNHESLKIKIIKKKIINLTELFCNIINPKNFQSSEKIFNNNNNSSKKTNSYKFGSNKFSIIEGNSFIQNSFRLKDSEIDKLYFKKFFIHKNDNSSIYKNSSFVNKIDFNRYSFKKDILNRTSSKRYSGDSGKISSNNNSVSRYSNFFKNVKKEKISALNNISHFRNNFENDVVVKKPNILFLVFLYNIEKSFLKFDMFYEKLDEFYLGVFKKNNFFNIKTVTFFIRNLFAFCDFFDVLENIDIFNQKFAEGFLEDSEIGNLLMIIKILKNDLYIDSLKNPKNFCNYFKKEFSFGSIFEVLSKNSLMRDETIINLKKKKKEIENINKKIFSQKKKMVSEKKKNFLLIKIFGFEKKFLNFFKKVIHYISNPTEFRKFPEKKLYKIFQKNFGNLKFYKRHLSWALSIKENYFWDFEDEFFFDVRFKNPIFILYLMNIIDNRYNNYMENIFIRFRDESFDVYKIIMKSKKFNILKIYNKFKNEDKKELKKILKIQKQLKNDKIDLRFLQIDEFYKIFPKLSKNLKKFFKIFFIFKDIKYKNFDNLKQIYFYFAKIFEFNKFLEEDFKKLKFILTTREKMNEKTKKYKTLSEFFEVLKLINEEFKFYFKNLISLTEYLYTRDENLEIEIGKNLKKSFDLKMDIKYIRIFLKYLQYNFFLILPKKFKKKFKINKNYNIYDELHIELSKNNEISENKMFFYFEEFYKKTQNKKKGDFCVIVKKTKNKELLKIFEELKYDNRKKSSDWFEEDFLKIKNFFIKNNQIENLFIFNLFYFFKNNSNIFLTPLNIWLTNKLSNYKMFKNGIIFFIFDYFLRGRALKKYEFNILLDFIYKKIFILKKDKNVLKFFDFSFCDNFRKSLSEDSPDFESLNFFIKNEKKTELILFLLELLSNKKCDQFYKKTKKNKNFYLEKFKIDIDEIYTIFQYIKKNYHINLNLLPNYKCIPLDEETKKIAQNLNLIENPEKFSEDILTKNFLLNNSELFKKLKLPISLCWIGVLFKRGEISLAKLFLKKMEFFKIF